MIIECDETVDCIIHCDEHVKYILYGMHVYTCVSVMLVYVYV